MSCKSRRERRENRSCLLGNGVAYFYFLHCTFDIILHGSQRGKGGEEAALFVCFLQLQKNIFCYLILQLQLSSKSDYIMVYLDKDIKAHKKALSVPPAQKGSKHNVKISQRHYASQVKAQVCALTNNQQKNVS